MSNQKTIILNRAAAFLAGGLLVFAIMSFTVVSTVKKQNTELEKTLDISRYEAGRLLSDAREQFTAGDFEGAKLSLNNLFDNQPGSKEAAEGKILLPEIETKEKAVNAMWETALPGVKSEWRKSKALELRAEWDADRVKLEKTIESKIDLAWEKAKYGIRSEWISKS